MFDAKNDGKLCREAMSNLKIREKDVLDLNVQLNELHSRQEVGPCPCLHALTSIESHPLNMYITRIDMYILPTTIKSHM